MTDKDLLLERLTFLSTSRGLNEHMQPCYSLNLLFLLCLLYLARDSKKILTSKEDRSAQSIPIQQSFSVASFHYNSSFFF